MPRFSPMRLRSGDGSVVGVMSGVSETIATDSEKNAARSRRQRLHRRAVSTGEADNALELEKKARHQQPDEPVHRNCDSFLSWSSEHSNYSGLINWAMTLLCLGGARLCLENILKYGILIDPPQWFMALNGGSFSLTDRHPSIFIVMYLLVHAFISLLLEKLLALGVVSVCLGVGLHVCNIVTVLLVPAVIHLLEIDVPLIGMLVISFACVVLTLKLISYVHVNKWCREYRTGRRRRCFSFTSTSLTYESVTEAVSEASTTELSPDSASVLSPEPASASLLSPRVLVSYPNNLSIADLVYFVAAPTLCYELNFPRSERIRVWFVCRRIAELIIGINVQVALFQQWMIPSVKNSLEPFTKLHLTHALERMLKMALPNHLLWILMFYLTFHSLFNLIAELLRFGDRRFYQDWWNSQDIMTFWRAWNVPVHRFAMRHLYLPLLRHRFSRSSASIAVFVISAFFHEYLVMVPLRLVRAWAFLGMVTQIPLACLTSVVRRKLSARLSNVMVWLSLIVGQPLAIMVYYHDYIIEFHRDLIV